jgi:hypothetical protein
MGVRINIELLDLTFLVECFCNPLTVFANLVEYYLKYGSGIDAGGYEAVILELQLGHLPIGRLCHGGARKQQ